MKCSFLFMCSGYYQYDGGYTPKWPGLSSFKGRVVHPQQWENPKDGLGPVEVKDQNVILIGSGATAVTMLPNLSKEASHVTMLQRSPTYIVAQPSEDAFAKKLSRSGSSDSVVHILSRWKKIIDLGIVKFVMKKFPGYLREAFLSQARMALPSMSDEEFELHFTPDYDVWKQRLCTSPDGDFFDALNGDTATIVTDHIETFTPDGIKLKSGKHLQADLIVTATGFNMQTNFPMSNAVVRIDGKQYTSSNHMSYKGALKISFLISNVFLFHRFLD